LALKLADRLQDDGHANIARAGNGNRLFDVRDLPDIRKFVENEVDEVWQFSVVHIKCLAAKLVNGLPHHDSEQKRKRPVRIG